MYIEVKTVCPFCGAEHSIRVSDHDYEAWQDGELAQNAFPYLSADEREMLISGICPSCWEDSFGIEDDEKEEEDEPILSYQDRICAIAEACNDNNIPYSVNKIWDGWQIRFPWCEGDIACHGGTYGHANGMVESYCFPWDEGDVSILSVQEAIEKVVNYYKEVVA